MKDLLTLIQHPSVNGFDKIMLATGRPITLLREGQQKAMGGPLNSQQLITLLKASLSPAVIADFGWGKELRDQIQSDQGSHAVRVVLKPEKSILIEVASANAATAASGPPAAADKPAPASPAVDDAPDVSEAVAALTDTEGAALVYGSGALASTAVKTLGDIGYDTRQTDNPHACMEVLKYHDYPVFILALDANYADDPVYRFLIKQTMDLRRRQYAILAAPGLVTGDTSLAFSLSVNYVIDADRLDQLPNTFAKAHKDWQRFVAPLHEYLEAAGRL